MVVECLVGCDVEKGFERLPVRLSRTEDIGWVALGAWIVDWADRGLGGDVRIAMNAMLDRSQTQVQA